ncbi:spore germination protein [Paenibacillus sp. CC-CFT747]|nr:spore germination protein [Paenibacillus sp. CC-CFT747]
MPSGILHSDGGRSWSLIPTALTTELPAQAVYYLKQGRVVLLLSGLPFALVLPKLWTDSFFLATDREFPYLVLIFMRILRILAFFLAIALPGLYVALISVNPDLLRVQLALSVAESRLGVPYPAMVEMLFVLLIVELILEASLRLPKSIGPAITMVGGIIVGQALVEARLVSNLLIIVVAASTIANFVVISVQTSFTLRLLKYFLLLFAGIYGIFGIFTGLFVLGFYMSQVSFYGIPFVSLWKKEEASDG